MTFRYEAVQMNAMGEWRVECVRHEREGEVEVTIFSGYEAEKRAKAYAAAMNRSAWGLCR